MQDDEDILHKTLMVEVEFFSGENEDKPNTTLMVKAQKIYMEENQDIPLTEHLWPRQKA